MAVDRAARAYLISLSGFRWRDVKGGAWNTALPRSQRPACCSVVCFGDDSARRSACKPAAVAVLYSGGNCDSVFVRTVCDLTAQGTLKSKSEENADGCRHPAALPVDPSRRRRRL